jgi:hypothetical protein
MIPWQSGSFFHGGAFHPIRYKELKTVLWRKGASRRFLRLIVIAPTGYRLHQQGRLLYRQPAFLLSTDRHSPTQQLIAAYLERWQIELNHREEKSTLGLGDAQVRNPLSVPRQPALVVAVYAMLLLAALRAYGPQRTSDYLPPPKWGRPALRHPYSISSACCANSVSKIPKPWSASPFMPPPWIWCSKPPPEKIAASHRKMAKLQRPAHAGPWRDGSLGLKPISAKIKRHRCHVPEGQNEVSLARIARKDGKRVRVPVGTAEGFQDRRSCGTRTLGVSPAHQPSRWDGAFSFHSPGNSCQATVIESLRDRAIPLLSPALTG